MGVLRHQILHYLVICVISSRAMSFVYGDTIRRDQKLLGIPTKYKQHDISWVTDPTEQVVLQGLWSKEKDPLLFPLTNQ